MGFSVQVGAFSTPSPAGAMEQALVRHGVEAFSFKHDTSLYKVRFGNYSSLETALEEARVLAEKGIIDDYFIVSPREHGGPTLRGGLVQTARSFLGVPYRWGGESKEEGFDCSGLIMTVYHLQGLKLPRSSRLQYRTGVPVGRQFLKPGDLVFFDTSGGGRPSHVGLYIGEGRFIHSPKRGDSVRIASMDNGYFAETYIGARSYLDSAE